MKLIEPFTPTLTPQHHFYHRQSRGSVSASIVLVPAIPAFPALPVHIDAVQQSGVVAWSYVVDFNKAQLLGEGSGFRPARSGSGHESQQAPALALAQGHSFAIVAERRAGVCGPVNKPLRGIGLWPAVDYSLRFRGIGRNHGRGRRTWKGSDRVRVVYANELHVVFGSHQDGAQAEGY
ncbi:hypothetical protein Pelo_14162 [Pelomyxa schiedti]|nr:hypothetical protein Pelo_14162 [Pelomyxa schiedti]